MAQRWTARVVLKDANGMQAETNVTVEAPNVDAAKEAAKEAAIDEMEFTGEHVSMTPKVEDIHPVA